MIRLLWATTNRLTRSGQVLGQEQRISILDAIKAVTVNAAYQYFEEDKKGTIEVGKVADFIILDRDILSVGERKILKTRIVATLLNGDIMYSNRIN